MAFSMRVVVSGYEQLVVNRQNIVATHTFMPALRDILEREPLYDFAAKVPERIEFQGRAPVYVIPLGPTGDKVAVRHAMRGGLISHVVKDLFLPPTRSLRELFTSIRLRLLSISTPEVVGIVTYPVYGIFRRSDIVTRYIEGGADLAAVFADPRNDEQRGPILDAVASLLGKMTAAGVQHEDINLKNILLTAEEDGYTAHLLDIDRVHFHVPNDPMISRANLDRLTRSLRKWRELPATRTQAFPDDDLQYLALSTAASTPNATPAPVA